LGTPVVSATPVPPGPVLSTSRIFVIALDAVGNQIINPTTFDIPINLLLSYNGLPAGDATLTVTYALPGEGTSPSQSTSVDQGSVTVLAPSDTVTLTVTGTSNVNTTFAPSVVANYTPQGGTLQTSAPLTYAVIIPVPAAVLTLTASHIDPFTSGVPATLSMLVANVGDAPTSGTIYMYVDPGYNGNYEWSYNGDGNDSNWSCTNYTSEIDCYTNNVIPGGGSLPLNFNVTPGSTTPQTSDVYMNGGGAVNGNSNIFVEDVINVATQTALAFSTPTVLFSGTCPSSTPCGFSQTVSVSENTFVGNINLTMAACPYFALNVTSVADSGSGSYPVVITPIVTGTVPSPATCTLTATDANNNTTTTSLQNTPLGVNVQ